MYRAYEIRLFKILSVLGDVSALLALTALGLHFWASGPGLPLRPIALVAVILSAFFKLQIFMFKLTVIEKRLLYLVEPSLQHFRIASRWSAVHLVGYFIVFWLVLIGIIASFVVPA